MVVLAGCDSRTVFRMLSVKHSGSTHDALAWNCCNLKQTIDKTQGVSQLPDDYYYIGDDAFTCTRQFLTPYSGHSITVWNDSFNFHLSSMRQVIERAFGILVQRFGIFWRELRMDYERWTSVITCCCILHNLCIKYNDALPEQYNITTTDADTIIPILNDNPNENADYRNGPNYTKRAELTFELASKGIVRPAK
jgi:hypothetical protein